MRINLHVIVIGAGLTGSFFLKEMIAYLHMKQEKPRLMRRRWRRFVRLQG